MRTSRAASRRLTRVIDLRADSIEIPLGETLTLQIDAKEEQVETRLLMRHEGVLYTRPWRDWELRSEDVVFPEAPGRYRLYVEWRTQDGRGGRRQLDFVVSPIPPSQDPVKTRMRDRSHLWAPTEWEGRLLQASEHAS